MAALLVIVPSLASAQYLKFLKDSPSAYFKGDDQQLMMKNVNDVLDSAGPHAKGEWSNPKTGSSGLAEVQSEFTNTDGALCKRLRIVNKAGGREGEAIYPVCKYEGRGWLVHPEAEPATPAPDKE
jgi:hypothetical protein